jgi:hypothetical protein|eukprot:7375957-Prymnesium_polylepis.1
MWRCRDGVMVLWWLKPYTVWSKHLNIRPLTPTGRVQSPTIGPPASRQQAARRTPDQRGAVQATGRGVARYGDAGRDRVGEI